MPLEQRIESEMPKAGEIGSISEVGQRKALTDKPRPSIKCDFKIIEQFDVAFESGRKVRRIKAQLESRLQALSPLRLRYARQPLGAIFRWTSEPLMAEGDAKRKSAHCRVQAFVELLRPQTHLRAAECVSRLERLVRPLVVDKFADHRGLDE